MSPKMKWIFSLARSSVEAPWSELWRMSEAKRALMELGHVAFACSGSAGPIIALHSSTAFSLFRMSIIQGPLAENKTVFTHILGDSSYSIPGDIYQSFLINNVVGSQHSICSTAPVPDLGCNGCFVNKTQLKVLSWCCCYMDSCNFKHSQSSAYTHSTPLYLTAVSVRLLFSTVFSYSSVKCATMKLNLTLRQRGNGFSWAYLSSSVA